MLYYHGEYSVAINVIYKGSHLVGGHIRAWDERNPSVIQLATLHIGSCKSMWTWDSGPRVFKHLILPAMHVFIKSLLLCNTRKLKARSLRFLGHSHQIHGKVKEEFVLFLLCSFNRGFVKATDFGLRRFFYYKFSGNKQTTLLGRLVLSTSPSLSHPCHLRIVLPSLSGKRSLTLQRD